MLLIKENLLEKMKHIEGLFIEGKDLALSVHYRHINKEKLKQVKETLYNTCGTLLNKGLIKVVEGKKAWEVLPLLPLDKSKAFLWMLKNLSFSYKRILPIYVGDDTTDESAFEVVNKRNGFSIFVGENYHSSCANYYLKSSKDIGEFLEKIKNY